MVTVQGNASRAITGGAGLDIPLEPPVLSAQQEVARRQRQIAAIEAAETAAARAAEQPPRPRRRRRNDALNVDTSVPRPAPAPEPEVLGEPEVPVAPVTAELPSHCGASEPEAMPGCEADAPTLVRQLRTELAMAGQRIRTLLAQVEEQGACITAAVADVQIATSLSAQLSELATEQQALLRARTETAEQDLTVAHRQIEALIAELATAPASAPALNDDRQAEPVLCLGAGCGLPVAPEFVVRTGYLWHGPCKDKVPAARFSTRRVA